MRVESKVNHTVINNITGLVDRRKKRGLNFDKELHLINSENSSRSLTREAIVAKVRRLPIVYIKNTSRKTLYKRNGATRTFMSGSNARTNIHIVSSKPKSTVSLYTRHTVNDPT